MTQDVGVDEAWKAPYVSYDTLSNFLERKLGDASTVPPRIDTHFLDSYAGSVRPLLLAALKTIGMVDEQNLVLDPLREAAASPAARKEVMRRWAVGFYSEQLELARRNATAAMLWESFSRHRYSGSTLRKAVVFFLALCEDVELPRSPHFKPPKQLSPSAPNGNRKRPVPRAGMPAAVAAEPQPTQPSAPSLAPAGESKVVRLGSAGTVTIAVDVKWLDLDDQTFQALRKAIKDLESLASEAAPDAKYEESDS